MVERGNTVPSVAVKLVDASGISDTTADVVLGTGTVVLFSVPGAFTPTCHVNHLPGFLANADKLRAAGIARIVCASVNDQHVMQAWAEATGALGKIDFIADGNAALAEALGLAKDFAGANMGKRYARAALVIRDGVVKSVFVEDAPGVSGSGAPAVLMALSPTLFNMRASGDRPMKFVNVTARAAGGLGLAVLLAGCSMGPMFGGGKTADANASLANTTASPTQIAQAQSSALPAIATQCPPIKVRPGGEAMFYYGNAKVGDATKLNYQAVISDTSRNCVVSNGLISVNMGVVGRVLLGPAGKQNSVTVPLRFAVERQGQAVYSEKFNIPVQITPPAESQDFVKVVNNVQVPYLQGDDITIWVGFDPRG